MYVMYVHCTARYAAIVLLERGFWHLALLSDPTPHGCIHCTVSAQLQEKVGTLVVIPLLTRRIVRSHYPSRVINGG